MIFSSLAPFQDCSSNCLDDLRHDRVSERPEPGDAVRDAPREERDHVSVHPGGKPITHSTNSGANAPPGDEFVVSPEICLSR